MSARLIIFFVSTVLVLSGSSYVEPLKKCNSHDNECLKKYFQLVIRGASKNGIPEIRVPAFDPVVINNFEANVTDYVSLQMVEGVGKGGRSCFVNNFLLNIPKGQGAVDLVCDVEVEGHYKAYSESPIIRNMLNGDTIYGDGVGSVKMDKVRFLIEFPFNVVSHGGDYFLNTDFYQAKYGFSILRDVNFAADNLYLGKQDASQTIVSIMNQQWKAIMSTVGSRVFNGVFKFMFDIGQKFFHSVPTKTYLNDDVSSYAVRY